MAAKPLTREERDDAQRFWHIRDYGFHYDTSRRYEATVRALEERIERLRTVMERHKDCCPPWVGDFLRQDDIARGDQ